MGGTKRARCRIMFLGLTTQATAAASRLARALGTAVILGLTTQATVCRRFAARLGIWYRGDPRSYDSGYHLPPLRGSPGHIGTAVILGLMTQATICRRFAAE